MSDNFRLLASMSYNEYLDNLDYKKNMSTAFKSKVDNKFDQSTSTRIIQEEYPYGSGKFRDLLCRVVSVRTVGTGSKMSDSYKTIIFKSQDYSKNVGYLYKFENNYWIAVNSDIMSSQTDSLVVRRCNNMLRWEDVNGAIQSVPISFEEEVFSPNNEIKQEVDRNNGYRKAVVQRTALTKTLQPNQRFIFGNQCLKISGSGIGAFLNQTTDDDNSPAVIRLNFEYDYINTSTDDVVNKIANAYSNEYSIAIDQNNSEYSLSSSAYVFTATALNNGISISKDLVWTIKSDLTYTSSQSNNNLNIVFNSAGLYTVSVELKDNPLIKATKDITIVSSDKYIIQCLPISEFIYKGDTELFTFELYKNGIKLTDPIFEFEKIDTLSLDYYAYSINNNVLSITNKKMSNTKVNIRCSSSNYTSALPYTFNIQLGGGW